MTKNKMARLWFSDVNGHLKEVVISADRLSDAISKGVSFDGSSIEGLTRVSESDMLLFPVEEDKYSLLTDPESDAYFCFVHQPNKYCSKGISFRCSYSPRNLLHTFLTDNSKHQFEIGAELEFYYHRDRVPLDDAGYFDVTPNPKAENVRNRTVEQLEHAGIPVVSSHHEVGSGQQEIVLQHTDPLTIADRIIAAKFIIKRVAAEHSIAATFMPKPFNNLPGSGMHLHISIKGHTDSTIESSFLRQNLSMSICGMANDMLIITNPTVNSYKRLNGGQEAPNRNDCGYGDRAALVRIPAANDRIEFRGTDARCNPYLAILVLLSAGNEDCGEVGSSSSKLMANLGDAIAYGEASGWLKGTLGEVLHKTIIDDRKAAWAKQNETVTEIDWELSK